MTPENPPSDSTPQDATAHGPQARESMPGEAYGQGATSQQPYDGKEAPQSGGMPSRLAILIAGATALVLLGAAGAAALLLSRGPQPQDVIPSTAVAIAVLDTDPSLGQKVNLVRLLNSLPDSDVTVDPDDPIGSLIEDPKSKQTWDKIHPWLGSKLAVALIPDRSGELSFLLAVEVTDEAKAKQWLDTELDEVAGPAGDIFDIDFAGENKLDYSMRDGYALVSNSSWIVDQAATTDSVLADSSEFSTDRARLGDQLAWGWFDATRATPLMIDQVRAESDLEGSDPFGGLLSGLTEDNLDFSGRYMFGVAAQPSDIEVTLLTEDARFGDMGELVTFTGKSDVASTMPEGTVAALGSGGISLGQAVLDALGGFEGMRSSGLSSVTMSTAMTVAMNASSLWALYEGRYGDSYVSCVSICTPEEILAASFADMGLPNETSTYSISGSGGSVRASFMYQDSGGQGSCTSSIYFSEGRFIAEDPVCAEAPDTAADGQSLADRTRDVLATPVSLYLVPLSDSPAPGVAPDSVVLIRVPAGAGDGLGSITEDLDLGEGQVTVESDGGTWLGVSTGSAPLTVEQLTEIVGSRETGPLSKGVPSAGFVSVADFEALKRIGAIDEGTVGPLSGLSLSVDSGDEPGDSSIVLRLFTSTTE